MRLCAAYKAFNGALYLPYSMKSVYDYVDRIVIFLSTSPWNGPEVPRDNTEEIVRSFPDPRKKITLVVKDFRYHKSPEDAYQNELLHVNEMLSFVKEESPRNSHYLCIDADEVYQPEHIQYLRNLLATKPEIGAVRSAWRCYWKSFRYWIDPIESSRPLVAFRVEKDTKFTGVRSVNMEPAVIPSAQELLIHHFSYALTADMVRAKIQAYSHCNEVRKDWFENVWLAWDKNRDMENIHPVWAGEYKKAVRADESKLPKEMKLHPFYGKDIA